MRRLNNDFAGTFRLLADSVCYVNIQGGPKPRQLRLTVHLSKISEPICSFLEKFKSILSKNVC